MTETRVAYGAETPVGAETRVVHGAETPVGAGTPVGAETRVDAETRVGAQTPVASGERMSRRALVGAGVAVAGAVAALAACQPVGVRRHAYLVFADAYRQDLHAIQFGATAPHLVLRGVFMRPAFSPDGGRIAVAKAIGDESLGVYGMSTVNFDGTGFRQITFPRPGAYADLDPAWSPDGRLIAFTRDTIGFGTGRGIWVMNADGSGVRAVGGAVGGEYPSWSPDGRSIVFATRDDIRIVPSAGGAVRVLARAPRPFAYTEPAWSPDGRRIAFIRHDAEGVDSLLVIDAGGGAITVVTSPNRSIEGPGWSRDSSSLTYLAFPGVGEQGRGRGVVYRTFVGGLTEISLQPTTPILHLGTWPG